MGLLIRSKILIIYIKHSVLELNVPVDYLKLKSRLVGIMRRHYAQVCVSVANQIVYSGTNFAFTMYIIRALSPEQYGQYVICFSIVLLYASVGNALFLTQMVVHIPEIEINNRSLYCVNMLGICFVFVLITVIITVFLKLLFSKTNSIYLDTSLFFAITAASVSTLLGNFFVRHAYSIYLEKKALIKNLSTAIVTFFALVVCNLQGCMVSASQALWIYALANFTGAGVGLINSGLSIKYIKFKTMWSVMCQSLSGGRWALGGVAVIWAQSQSYMYVTAYLLGVEGVATINAGRVLISPFTFLMPAFEQLILPRLAQNRLKNPSHLISIGIQYALGMVLAGFLYVTCVAAAGQWVIPLFIGHKYDANIVFVIFYAWSFVLLFQLCRTAASQIFQANLQFKSLTLANIISALVTVLASFLLSSSFGLVGAVLAVGLGEFFLVLLLVRSIKK